MNINLEVPECKGKGHDASFGKAAPFITLADHALEQLVAHDLKQTLANSQNQAASAALRINEQGEVRRHFWRGDDEPDFREQKCAE